MLVPLHRRLSRERRPWLNPRAFSFDRAGVESIAGILGYCLGPALLVFGLAHLLHKARHRK